MFFRISCGYTNLLGSGERVLLKALPLALLLRITLAAYAPVDSTPANMQPGLGNFPNTTNDIST